MVSKKDAITTLVDSMVSSYKAAVEALCDDKKAAKLSPREIIFVIMTSFSYQTESVYEMIKESGGCESFDEFLVKMKVIHEKMISAKEEEENQSM